MLYNVDGMLNCGSADEEYVHCGKVERHKTVYRTFSLLLTNYDFVPLPFNCIITSIHFIVNSIHGIFAGPMMFFLSMPRHGVAYDFIAHTNLVNNENVCATFRESDMNGHPIRGQLG